MFGISRSYYLFLVVFAVSATGCTLAKSSKTSSVEVNTTGLSVSVSPTVSSVSPTAGSLSGSTSITISGTNFVKGASVYIGTDLCTNVSVSSSTSLSCKTPAHSTAETVNVRVLNPSGKYGTGFSAYTYQDEPTVTGVSPNVGPQTGSTSITITGTGFVSGATVTVGGSSCTSVSVNSSTQITCTTPSGTAGPASIIVTNADTQYGTLTNGFLYQTTATVSSVSPTSGPITGGTALTITGTGFLAGATVALGGTACLAVTVVTSSQITCTTDAHAAGTVNVTVTNSSAAPGTLLSGFTYSGPPTVTAISLTAGSTGGGTTVTLTGTNLTSGGSVDIGGVACGTYTVSSSTSATCITGANAAGTYDVTVTNPDTQTGTLSNGYTYQDAPTVAMIAANNGVASGGTSVTLTGTGYLSGASVAIGGVSCSNVVVVNATTITCDTGANTAGTYDVVVTNSDTQTGTLANGYTYNAAPTVSSISPQEGSISGGTAVTLTGTNYAAGATVSIGGSNCGGLTVVNATTITCTTTAHAWGYVDVVVTNSDTQTGTLSSGFNYTYGIWSPTAGMSTTNAPTARLRHTAVYSGTLMVVWGGFNGGSTLYATGGYYDPATDTWAATNAAGAPTARYGHTAIWDSANSQMIVWGGYDGSTYLNSGAIYNPATDTWTSTTTTTNAPTARFNHSAVWDSTNSQMIVFGGYDTTTSYVNSGGIYDPVGDSWTATTTTNAPTARDRHTAVWNDATNTMLVFGGHSSSGASSSTGGIYDPVGDSWSSMTTTNTPSGRYDHTAVWTGTYMIVFGGFSGSALNTGGLYDPAGDSWTTLTTTDAPTARLSHSAVWDGSEMIVFGGYSSSGTYLNTGGYYNVAGTYWADVSTYNAPTARSHHTAIWDGTRMLIWGGYNSVSGPLNTGGVYTAAP